MASATISVVVLVSLALSDIGGERETKLCLGLVSHMFVEVRWENETVGSDLLMVIFCFATAAGRARYSVQNLSARYSVTQDRRLRRRKRTYGSES